MAKNEKTILVVRTDASELARRAVERALVERRVVRELERECRWHEPGMLSVHVSGGAPADSIASLRAVGGIERVDVIPPGTRLTGRARWRDFTVTLANGAAFGGGEPVVIAGPCAIEGESQIREVAALVEAQGARVLRGGAFKPRTSPYTFGGLGERGLDLLARAGEETGLPVVSEALEMENVDAVARHCDVIQIGSRNMSNFPLLFRVGAHASQKPVLLKRGLAATYDELLDAAEYVLLGRVFAGAERPGLILCERGIRTFESTTRFTLDVAAIPVLKDRTGLPVIADPSHPAGQRRFVRPLAAASIAAGADGLAVEVHRDPDESWCDAAHSLDPASFRALMEDVRRHSPSAVASAVGSRSV